MTKRLMYERELKIAIQAVKKSAITFRKYFGLKTNVRIKRGDYRNLVSLADTKIENEISKFMAGHFPDHGFHGEETGLARGDSKFVWVLDPVDGTTNYIQGHPECVISLALLKEGKPVVGVVYAPVLGELYTATLGGGAECNGKKISVSNVKEIKKSFVALAWAKNLDFAVRMFPRILPNILTLRVAGSATLAFCYIARGTYDFFFGRSGGPIWDTAAGEIMIREAGGETLYLPSGIQIAANKVLAAKLFELFK